MKNLTLVFMLKIIIVPFLQQKGFPACNKCKARVYIVGIIVYTKGGSCTYTS